MNLQDEIYNYLKENTLTAQEIRNIIEQRRKRLDLSKEFLIGDEVARYETSKTKYFQIFYFEDRTDQMFVQLTPLRYFRSGHLAVNQDGEISLLDDTFKNYRASVTFSFDLGTRTLKAQHDIDIEGEERLSSQCIKGIVGFGLFATTAVCTTYIIMHDENNPKNH